MTTAVALEYEHQAAELEREAIDIASRAPNAFFIANRAQWKALSLINEVTSSPSFDLREKPIFLMTAGNGVGKTRLLSEIVSNLVCGVQSEWFDTPFWQNFKRPLRIRMTSSKKALEEGLLRELGVMLAPYMAPGYPRAGGEQWLSQWKTTDGSRLDVYTWNQSARQHAGGTSDVLVWDEPGPKDIAEEDLERLRWGGPTFWFQTPVDENGKISADVAWVFDAIRADKEKDRKTFHVISADKWDNCRERVQDVVKLPNGSQRRLEGTVSEVTIQSDFDRLSGDADKAVLLARFYGQFSASLGLVLKEFDEARHVFSDIQVHPSWPRYAAIDVHPSKPQVFIYGAIDNFSVFYVLKEIVSTELIPAICEEIRRVFMAYGFPRMTLVDPLASTPNPLTGRSIMDEYRKQLTGGNIVSAGAEKTDKSLGIALMRERLAGVEGRPLLKIHKSCKYTISQANRWMIDPRTLAPAKENDDSWECLYRITLNLPQFQTQAQSDLEAQLAAYGSRSSLVI